MSKTFQFRSGSVIYFEGDDAAKVFILQKGKVSLISKNIQTGEDVKEQVQSGEFFGVKSALGHFPREENAIALTDSIIMSLTVHEFENLAMSNTRIILKMLKVFSNQMRRIHNHVASLMEEEHIKPDEGLFNVGVFYLKNSRFSQARYVFNRYLTFYPSGKNADQAEKNLELAESALAHAGKNKEFAPDHARAAARTAVLPPARETAVRPPAEAPVPAAQDLSAQEPSAQDPSALEPDSFAPIMQEPPAAAKAYYDAISFISQEKYQQAYLAFKKIVETDEAPEWTARSAYEIGRCLFLFNKYDDCIQYFTSLLTQYPKHPELKNVMFFIGQCHEKTGRPGQAAAFYKKIVSMSADSNDSTAAKARRALQAMGGS